MRDIVRLAFLLGCLSTAVHGDPFCACQSSGGCNFSEVCLPVDSCRKKNVAVGKPANISSLYRDSGNTAGPACLAVNGNHDTTFKAINKYPNNPNCIHTAHGDKRPFWEVDLGQKTLIVAITVYARNEHLVRMSHVNLTVDNEERYVFPAQNLSLKTEITFNPPLSGSVVRLSKNKSVENDKDPFLNFCELQVWACEDKHYGSECTRCGKCKDNSPCGKPNGFCPKGCDSGWDGPRCDRKTIESSTSTTLSTSATSSTWSTTATSSMSSTSRTSAVAVVWITTVLMSFDSLTKLYGT